MSRIFVFSYSHDPESRFYIDSTQIPGHKPEESFPRDYQFPDSSAETRSFDSRRYLKTIDEGTARNLGAERETRIVPTKRVLDMLRESGLVPKSDLAALTTNAEIETRERRPNMTIEEVGIIKPYGILPIPGRNRRYNEAMILIYKDPLLGRDEELIVFQKERKDTDYTVVPGRFVECTPRLHITDPLQRFMTHIDVECIIRDREKQEIGKFLEKEGFEGPVIFWW